MPRCTAVQEVGDNRVRGAGGLREVRWASLLLLPFSDICISFYFLLFSPGHKEIGERFGRFQTGSKYFEKWNLPQTIYKDLQTL
jgi:hypothetical protein